MTSYKIDERKLAEWLHTYIMSVRGFDKSLSFAELQPYVRDSWKAKAREAIEYAKER